MALMATSLAILFPNFTVQKEAEISNKLGRLASDVRSAFDLAVLSRKTYRIAFNLRSGDYWLEVTPNEKVTLASLPPQGDLTEEQLKELQESFRSDFEKYQQLTGEPVSNPNSEEKIRITGPVVMAENKLRWPSWNRVESLDWKGGRTLGPEMMIRTIQAEHHREPVTIDGKDIAEPIIAYVYFFPVGYVEKAYLNIYMTIGDTIDEAQKPYTVTTKPRRGVAEITSGLLEVNLQDADPAVDE